MRIVCQQTFLMNNIPYLLFLKNQQNLKLSSAANIGGALRFKQSGLTVLLKNITQCLPLDLNKRPFDFKTSTLPLSHLAIALLQ